MNNWLSIVKDYIWSLLIAILPFAPTIYDRFTESTLHFVYEVKNQRNPSEEWNRRISSVFKNLDNPQKTPIDKLPAPLLKEIGSEIYRALPAMLSGIGYQPFDSSKVMILNVANQEIRNIRVHFSGCEGYQTYETWPDSRGSVNNPSPNDPKKPTGQITLRYDKLSPSANRTTSIAQITFFGESTSDCTPTVEAELADGKVAVGKKAPLQDYLNESSWEKHNEIQRIDFFFKLFLSFAVIYVFLQVHGLKKRLNTKD
ncbi:hypothetical protein [Nitrosomonas sp.]|uniref:hypothetical protein n=1 Tax=Nitrosomonas sp. TaxID=42353 RepID=UPI0025F4689B|nr:hypothetical protein [Nitrosomonas sp.]MBV6447798.1 hypothetical protein [Nitrosomonas sp.]